VRRALAEDQGLRPGRRQIDEGFYVHSGAEGRLACAGEENRLHARSEIGDDVAELAQVLRMQDVELLRPVEGDPEGMAAVLCLDIPHVLLLPSVGRVARPPQDAFRLDIEVRGAPAEALPTPTSKLAETVSEKYLPHIRNVVVAAVIIWIAGAVIGGIAYIVVTAHDHAVTQENACNKNGGIWVNGQCLP
jgi:hypothetical protein